MRILVYGAGANLKMVCSALERMEDQIVCISDKDATKVGKKFGSYDIVAPTQIKNYSYDRIIVSLEKRKYFDEIKNELITLGIDEQKVVFWQDYLIMLPRDIGTMIVDWSKNLTPSELYSELCSHADKLSKLEKEFLFGEHNRSYKWLHYFEIYNRHFAKFYDKDITIMEIGVNKGGSLQLWKKMFGSKSKIIGVDINPDCKRMEDDQISIYIGDQADRNFWKQVKSEIPQLDILIDDGGHEMQQQIVTFEEMYPCVNTSGGGVYLCEDTCTSYDSKKYHNAGYHNPNNFIEYSKNFIDYIHAWFSKEQELQINDVTRTAQSLHYYSNVLVIEKRPMYPQFDMEVCNNKTEKYAIPHLRGMC